MNFRYKARDPLGKDHEGKIEGATAEEAQQKLRQDGFQGVKVVADNVPAIMQRRVTKNEIIYMTNQLAVMVDTGITLSSALESISEQEENPTLKTIVTEMKIAVESGTDFSVALEKYPKYFDKTYIALVQSSEATGTLAEMLERIGAYLRKEADTKGKVRGALAYPMIMATVAVGVTFFLLTYVLPKFEPLFRRQGDALPKITRVMMTTSQCLIEFWYAWLIGFAALIAGFLYFRKTPTGRAWIDWVKIRAPVIGPVCRKVAISRSLRTLGTLLASGVSVLEALRMAANVTGNRYYEEAWMTVHEDVTGGRQIHETLSKLSLFPSMLVQMIRSGEETAKLEAVLDKVCTHYDDEVDMAIKTATSLIEPIMITVMGVVVGGMAMALMLPIFALGRHPS